MRFFNIFTKQSPPHVVLATFNFKTIEDKNGFLGMLNGPDGLIMTRASPGCRLIECLSDNSDENKLVIRQEWDNQEDHEAYFQKRVESGMIENLKEILNGEIQVMRFSKLNH
tara:strand:- start:281 stop:616 length:336 start_codon:yes stop_codon:yes gene_type:complete